jgi:hypothetical protein
MKIFKILFNQSTININTLIKDANKVAWNKANSSLPKPSSTNTTNKLVTSKANITNQNKKGFFEFLRNNKLAAFLVILVSTNLVYYFVPVHKKRPEILSRNRLEKHE